MRRPLHLVCGLLGLCGLSLAIRALDTGRPPVAGLAVAGQQDKAAVKGDQPAAKKDQPAEKKDQPAEKKTGRNLSKFMRAKLASTQLILEGLCVENFDFIENGTAQLLVISAAEEWRVSEDPLYSHHSAEFRRVAKNLKKQAQDANLEGAALSYVELTMSCIECHRFVRTVMLAEGPIPAGRKLPPDLSKLLSLKDLAPAAK